MSEQQKTRYAGVTFREAEDGKDKVFYIRYRRGGRGSKETREPVGKARQVEA